MAKKRYDQQPEEEPMMVNEPAVGYDITQSAEIADYEEDLADSLSSEELRKNMFQYIDKLFGE